MTPRQEFDEAGRQESGELTSDRLALRELIEMWANWRSAGCREQVPAARRLGRGSASEMPWSLIRTFVVKSLPRLPEYSGSNRSMLLDTADERPNSQTRPMRGDPAFLIGRQRRTRVPERPFIGPESGETDVGTGSAKREYGLGCLQGAGFRHHPVLNMLDVPSESRS